MSFELSGINSKLITHSLLEAGYPLRIDPQIDMPAERAGGRLGWVVLVLDDAE